jgi:hypothetical protein
MQDKGCTQRRGDRGGSRRFFCCRGCPLVVHRFLLQQEAVTVVR